MNAEQMEMFVIEPDATLQDAMSKMEENSQGTVVVVDFDYRALGTLTDGDIRKAMLDHRMLLTPVRDIMNTGFLFVLDHEQEKSTELFRRFPHVRILPVLDSRNALQDIRVKLPVS